MQIVLSGALPDPHQARELLSFFEQKAPTLVHWLQQSDCQLHLATPAETQCTALEVWQLKQAGFIAQPAQHLSAGLGPLLVKKQNAITKNPDQAIWLAELVHIAPSRDGAALIPSTALDISEAESLELLSSSKEWFVDTGFDAELDSAQRWRLTVPADFNPSSASTALVSQSMVNDWWEQDLHSRPWRRLINEFQMLWFNHPVNKARAQLGKLPINSLWLLGGAAPSQFSNLQATINYELRKELEDAAAYQDWGRWLACLTQLEHDFFAPLAKEPTPELILCGVERYLHCKPKRPNLFQRLLSNPKYNWRKVWSPL